MKKYILAVSSIALILSGCVSNLKSSFWIPVRDNPTQFDQAIAKCDYDLKILGRDNGRPVAALFGMQDPTFESCMKVMGYAWMKKEEVLQSEVRTPENPVQNRNDEATKIAEFRAGAEKGDVKAEVNLAYKYLNGFGVPKSYTQAYKLYIRAAEKVDINREHASNAQVNLGAMYKNGYGVEADQSRALMWFQISKLTGSEEGSQRYTELALKSNQIQILKANRLTNLCIAKKYRSCDEPATAEWKMCEPKNISAPTQQIAKKLSDLNLSFVFNKNQLGKSSKLYTITDYKIMDIKDLEMSGRGIFNENEKYTAYTSSDKAVGVQEFDDSGGLLISISFPGDNHAFFPTECSN